MAWFSVHIETRGDEAFGMTGDDLGERLGDLLVALKPWHGSVSGGGDPVRWAAISVESPSALTAIAEASAVIRREAALTVFLWWSSTSPAAWTSFA
jgi:hypothetical protein